MRRVHFLSNVISFTALTLALQQGESLSSWLWLSGDDYAYSSAFQRWWPLALKEGDVTPRVVELAPTCSGLGLAPPSWKTRSGPPWILRFLPGRPGAGAGPLWRTSWVLPHQDSPVLIRARSQTVCWSWKSKAREVEGIKIFHDTQSSRTSDG